MNRKAIVAWTAVMALACGAAQAAEPSALRIRGANGELTIDAKGISLAPSAAGCPAVRGKGAPAWAVLVQKDAAPPVDTTPVVLKDQGQQGRREALADGIRLSYARLTDGRRTWQIGLTLEIRAKGEAFEVTGTIRNQEPGWIVCGFVGPALAGIEADLATHPLLLPEGFGRRICRAPSGKGKPPRPWREAGGRFEAESTYPGRAGTMQWCALAGPDGGLYLGCHDAEHGAKTFSVRYDPQDKRLGMAIRHEFFCPAGRQWTLPATVLMPYQGDWHAAARYYREWVDAATPVRRTPDWVRNASGWLLCILKQQNGEVLWDYPSLVKLAEVADARGIDILGLFGWAHGGHDHLYPDYFPDPKMGGPQALRRALAEVRRLGKRSIIYANGQLEERGTEFWHRQGKDLAVIKADGTSVQQTWHKYRNAPAYEFDLACLAAQGWYDRMLSLAIQAHELGADGILFDQLGNTPPMACYAAGHGHAVPEMVYAADRVRLLRRIADHMRSVNPDFIVMTEGLHDSVADSISLFHGCVLGVFAASSGELLAGRAAGAVSAPFPEMFRYTYPELMSTMRVPTPMANRLLTNYACLYGFRHEIESRYAPDVSYLRENKVPEASQYDEVISKPDVAMMQATPPAEATRYLKQVIDFQRKNADLLWLGRFTDDEGFTLDGKELLAKSYVSGDRLGIVVWNPTAQPAAVKLRVPGAELVTASEPERDRVEAISPLGPQSVRLLMWKRR